MSLNGEGREKEKESTEGDKKKSERGRMGQLGPPGERVSESAREEGLGVCAREGKYCWPCWQTAVLPVSFALSAGSPWAGVYFLSEMA